MQLQVGDKVKIRWGDKNVIATIKRLYYEENPWQPDKPFAYVEYSTGWFLTYFKTQDMVSDFIRKMKKTEIDYIGNVSYNKVDVSDDEAKEVKLS